MIFILELNRKDLNMFKFILPKLLINIERWKWNSEYRIYVSNTGRFKDEYKKELQILKDAGKDTTELEKEYTDKRNEILKSGLLKGNQTVFEELNERFQKEYELYKDAEEDTYELEKAYKRKNAK